MRQQDDLTNQLMEEGSQQRTRLIRLCTRMTGKTDVAEDLAQEALLEAWKHLHSLRDPQRFSPWLAGIARNLCLRWKRAQERERTHIDEQQLTGQFLTDARGKRVAVQIYLKRHSRLWEDFEDVLVANSRRREKNIPIERVKASLVRRGRLSG